MTFRELITQELMSQLQIGEPTAAALVAGDIGIEDADDPLPAEWEAGIRKYFAEHKGDVLASLKRGYNQEAELHRKRLLKKNRNRGRVRN